jgi:hypothetical protein
METIFAMKDSPVKMTADGGPRTANFRWWWRRRELVERCAAAHEISLENDDGRRTADGEFSFVVLP